MVIGSRPFLAVASGRHHHTWSYSGNVYLFNLPASSMPATLDCIRRQ
jgi:hypothetical protein